MPRHIVLLAPNRKLEKLFRTLASYMDNDAVVHSASEVERAFSDESQPARFAVVGLSGTAEECRIGMRALQTASRQVSCAVVVCRDGFKEGILAHGNPSFKNERVRLVAMAWDPELGNEGLGHNFWAAYCGADIVQMREGFRWPIGRLESLARHIQWLAAEPVYLTAPA